jgi:hypothetical protein
VDESVDTSVNPRRTPAVKRIALTLAALALPFGAACSSSPEKQEAVVAADPTTSTTSGAMAAMRSICVRLNEVAGYSQTLDQIPHAANEYPSPDDDARYAQVKNLQLQSALAASQLAGQVTQAELVTAIRAIGTWHASGQAPAGLERKMPEIVKALVDGCGGIGSPITTGPFGEFDLL